MPWQLGRPNCASWCTIQPIALGPAADDCKAHHPRGIPRMTAIAAEPLHRPNCSKAQREPHLPTQAERTDPHTMRCLEVWGGNEAVNHGVVMPGIDAWLYSRPYQGDDAGGDLHYVSSCAAGLVTRIMIADVSGHGQTVAHIARKLRGLMRLYVNYIDQARFVRGVNTEFAEFSESGGFATAAVATYLAPEDKLTISNAGHPRPLWFQSKTRTWTLMHEADTADTQGLMNVPLGIAEPTEYSKVEVKFTKGDMVVFYTDAMIEAKDTTGQLLGTEGLLELVQGFDASDPGDFLHDLLEAVGQKTAGAQSNDDVTVLILRANGLKPRASFGVVLRAQFRMCRGIVIGLIPGSPKISWPDAGPLLPLRNLVERLTSRYKGQLEPKPGKC